MDDAPYSLQFFLLQGALRGCKLQPVAHVDAEAIAKGIASAVRRFRVCERLTSVKRAKDEIKRTGAEEKRASDMRFHATELARLLSTQDGPLAASLESYFDRPVWPLPRIREIHPATLEPKGEWTPQYREDDDDTFALDDMRARKMTSAFELTPALIELAEWAELHVSRPNAKAPAIPKEKGRSPMQKFIRDLAPQFKALTGEKAFVTTIESGRKGGKFPDFVRAVARQWKIKPPSVEAIAQALRSD